jgi:hypothetical protein
MLRAGLNARAWYSTREGVGGRFASWLANVGTRLRQVTTENQTRVLLLNSSQSSNLR